MRILLNILVALATLVQLSCTKQNSIEKEKLIEVPLAYATGFKIYRSTTYTRVDVLTAFKGANKTYRYVLYQNGTNPPNVEADARIRLPISTIVCTSTSHIPLLDYLGLSDRLIGFPSTDYICSTIMRQRIDSGRVAELGIDNDLNIEKLLEINPDLVMAYTMNKDMKSLERIKEASIPVVLNADYMEPHPLGRAEWIKFMGLLFNKEEMADSIFNSIEDRYQRIKQNVQAFQSHPSVITGVVYGDSWFLPGGKSYVAKLFEDAGCTYYWSNTPGASSLPLSFETVYQHGHDAKFWIGVGSFKSLKALQDSDERYTSFDAFKNHEIYSYNRRMGAKGGSEYLELGYLRPDLILSDLVTIAHPELFSAYKLYFYYRLP